MKTMALAAAGLVIFAATGSARIGEDEKQIEARYGQPGKDLGTHNEVHELGYAANGFMIVVDFVNGVSRREGFTKPDTSTLTEENLKDILAMSAEDGTTWQDAPTQAGAKQWNRSDKKAIAIFPALGKFLFIQDVSFVQPK